MSSPKQATILLIKKEVVFHQKNITSFGTRVCSPGICRF